MTDSLGGCAEACRTTVRVGDGAVELVPVPDSQNCTCSTVGAGGCRGAGPLPGQAPVLAVTAWQLLALAGQFGQVLDGDVDVADFVPGRAWPTTPSAVRVNCFWKALTQLFGGGSRRFR